MLPRVLENDLQIRERKALIHTYTLPALTLVTLRRFPLGRLDLLLHEFGRGSYYRHMAG